MHRDHPTPKTPSRIHRAAVVQRELRRLRRKVEHAHSRAVTVEEKAWCLQVADALDRLIAAGDAALPPFHDPRPARKARKRSLLEELAP